MGQGRSVTTVATDERNRWTRGCARWRPRLTFGKRAMARALRPVRIWMSSRPSRALGRPHGGGDHPDVEDVEEAAHAPPALGDADVHGDRLLAEQVIGRLLEDL